jgi:hypothetical protein
MSIRVRIGQEDSIKVISSTSGTQGTQGLQGSKGTDGVLGGQEMLVKKLYN